MKRISTVIAILISFSVSAQKQKDTTEKVYKVSLTETEITKLYQTLEVAKNAFPTSTIPMNVGVHAMKNIEEMEAIIQKEYKSQQPKK